jgi:hypothetical protein
VEITSQGQALMLTVATDGFPRTGPRTSLYWQSGSALPVLAGSIANPDPEAQWLTAGAHLYSVAATAEADFLVRRLSVAGLGRAEDQAVSPDLEQTVAGPTAAGLDRRLAHRFAVDASSGELVVAETRAGSSSSASLLGFYAQNEAGLQLASTASFPSDTLVDIGIAAGRTLLLFADRAVLLSRSGATLATFNLAGGGSLTRLLSLDEANVYLAATVPRQDQPSPFAVLVLDASDLSLVARYALPDEARSTVAVGDLRIFGTVSTLVVATPLCSARAQGIRCCSE